jgi:phospholipid transport system substrate-binding protein
VQIRLIALAALLLTMGSHTALATPSATDQVRTTTDAVLMVLKREDLDSEAKRTEMRAIIGHRFNFRNMSRRALRRTWKTTSVEQQDRFVELFTEVLANTYLVAIEEYTDEGIEYTGETITDAKYAKVETVIVGDKMKTPLHYMLELEGSEWRVFDVVVEGISLISNYRGSFNSLVRRGGMGNLIAKLEEKVEQNAI